MSNLSMSQPSIPLVDTHHAATSAGAGEPCAATIEELKDAGCSIIEDCPVCHHAVARHTRAEPAAEHPRVHHSTTTSPRTDATSVVNAFVKLNSLLPKWRHTSVCRTFLQRITQILSTSGIDRSQWNLVFMYVVDDVTAAEWISDNIISKQLDWEKSKAVFTSHFEVSDYRVTLQREYNSCRQGRGESVQAYSDRFSDICSQLGVEDDNPLAISHFLDHLNDAAMRAYYNALAMLQLTQEEYKIESLSKTIALCIKLDVASKTGYVHSGGSAPSGAQQDARPKHCKFHPESKTHSTNECKTNPSNRSGTVASGHAAAGVRSRPEQTKDPYKSSGDRRCYTCNQPGHISTNCPQKNRGSGGSSDGGPSSSGQWRTPLPGANSGAAGRHSDRQSVQTPRLTYDHNGQKTTTIKTETTVSPNVRGAEVMDTQQDTCVAMVSTLDRTLPAAVFVPTATKRNVLFLYRQVPYEALLDTGANTSCIAATLVEELGILVTPAAGAVKLANGTLVDRLGVTEPLEITAVFPVSRVKLPSQPIAHPFEVMDLSSQPHQFILGMDLLEVFFPFPSVPPWEFFPSPARTVARQPTIGAVSVAGLSADLPIGAMSGEGELPVVELPERAELCTPDSMEDVYATERAKIMDDPDIKEALAANSTVTGFCNLPESVVRLDVDQELKYKLFRKQYKVPEAVKPKVDEIVQRWLASGKICLAPPGCPYNSPLLVVPKKDDAGQLTGVRVCLDVRALNAATLQCDKFQIPKIRDALESFGRNTIFGEFDLQEAYLQFRLDDESRPYTAFTWNGVQYMFVGAPFGLQQLPSHFQRAMSFSLSDIPFTFAILDNIPFGSKTWEQHRQQALCIIHRMTQLNLLIKPSSVKLGHAQIKCLGHVLSNRGVGIDPAKLDDIRHWPLPKSGEMLARFLGFAQYIRDHVRHFADLTAPLEAVKNDKEIVWTDALMSSFDMTKQAILRAPFLQFPDFSRPFHLATDAANTGSGGVLYQPEEQGDNITGTNIVAIHSKILSRSQRNYPAYKKELLAIVSCLRQFHSYIWGRSDLVIFTDHKPLTFMLSQTELSPALQCWLDVILDYSFEIRYRPGVLNVMPDVLSRMYTELYQATWGVPSDVLTVDEDGTVRVGPTSMSFASAPPIHVATLDASSDRSSVLHGEEDAAASSLADALAALAATDKAVADVAAAAADAAQADADADADAEGDTDPDPPSKAPPSPIDLAVEMEKRGKTSPPTSVEKVRLIQTEHERGHFGREAVYKALWNKNVWWPTMRADIISQLADCDACTRFVVTRAGYNPGEYITAAGPWDHIQIDCSTHLPPTPAGHRAMLVIIDVFTGFCLLRAMKTTSADEVAPILWDVFTTFGFPKILQSDNGPEFTNDVLRALVRLTGVQHRFISPYNPRADGKVERCIGTTTGILKKLLHGTDDLWSVLLPWAQWCFNNKVSSLTNSAPASLMFGRQMNEVKDYTGEEPVTVTLANWKKHQEKIMSVIYPAITDRTRTAKEKMVQAWNKQRRQLLNNALPNGAIVMLVDQTRKDKFEPKYVGPYHVIRRSRNGAYVLRDPATGDMLDRHVPPDQLKLVSKKPRPSDLREHLYQVDSILDHRGEPGSYEYLVKWQHYNDRTWEPAAGFLDDTVIRNYWKNAGPLAARR